MHDHRNFPLLLGLFVLRLPNEKYISSSLQQNVYCNAFEPTSIVTQKYTAIKHTKHKIVSLCVRNRGMRIYNTVYLNCTRSLYNQVVERLLQYLLPFFPLIEIYLHGFHLIICTQTVWLFMYCKFIWILQPIFLSLQLVPWRKSECL